MADISDVFAVPLMWTELAAASWETMWRRTALIATGACSAAEYERMVNEKMRAAQLSTVAFWTGRRVEDVLGPFHTRATANARRLRRT